MARRGTVISPVAEQISELSARVQMSQSFYLASPGEGKAQSTGWGGVGWGNRKAVGSEHHKPCTPLP